jgi:hypothetical protein
MNVLWGSVMAAVGIFFVLCGSTKSKFFVYQILVARSRIMWGEDGVVHLFYLTIGLIIVVLGGLWAAGFIW